MWEEVFLFNVKLVNLMILTEIMIESINYGLE